MKDIGVYLFHNVHTGFFYIGSGILDARERAHFGALKKRAHWNPNLQAAFDSDARFDFVGVPVLGESEKSARKLALRIEAELVSENVGNPMLTNIMLTGIATPDSYDHSAETRAVLSAKQSENWRDPKYRERMRIALSERYEDPSVLERHSAAVRAGMANMSLEQRAARAVKSGIGRRNSYEERGGSHLKGTKKSDQFRRHDSDKIKALWQDPDYRSRQLEERRNRGPVENPNSKRVMVDGTLYRTITDAAIAHGITKQSARYRLSSDTFPNWTGVETNIQGDGA